MSVDRNAFFAQIICYVFFKQSSECGFHARHGANEGAFLLLGCSRNCPMESLSRFSDQTTFDL